MNAEERFVMTSMDGIKIIRASDAQGDRKPKPDKSPKVKRGG